MTLSRFALQHRLLLIFTFLALAIKATIPAGYMLSQDANGETIISLCSSDGSREVYYNAATNTIRELNDRSHDTDGSEHGAQVCPFSSLMHAAVTAPVMAGVQGEPAPQQHFLLPESRISHSAHLRGRPAPRAPPAKSFL